MRRPTQRERESVETGREQRETFTHNRERQDQREPDTQRWKPQLFSHLTSSGVTGVTMKHFPRITRQFYSRSPQSLPDGSFLRLKSPKNVGKSWKKLEKHEQVLEELGEWRPGQKSDFPAAPRAPEKIDFQSECAPPGTTIPPGSTGLLNKYLHTISCSQDVGVICDSILTEFHLILTTSIQRNPRTRLLTSLRLSTTLSCVVSRKRKSNQRSRVRSQRDLDMTK